MKLSIVATLYESAPYVKEFCRRATAAARAVAQDDYEIILVNDGSPDDSLAIAVDCCDADPHVTVVDLSRNFGHHKAMMTGLAHSEGERVFLIDSDLEEEPEWLMVFADQLESEHCDVVFGVQARRKGGLFERLSGQWYYYSFRLLTGLLVPENMVTARLMTRRYVEALLLHQERDTDIGGLWYITGFDQLPRQIKKHATSPTTYSLRRKISLFINSVTSFSNRPLIYISYVGLLLFVISSIYIVYLIFHWMFLAEPLSGWTSVMASIWALGGLTILFIGIIGIYLSKVFMEIKQRPYTIIRHVYRKSKNDD